MQTDDAKNELQGCPYLSDEQINDIAEKAAVAAIKKMQSNIYEEVGRTVLKKLFWLAGVVIVGFTLWLSSKGFIN